MQYLKPAKMYARQLVAQQRERQRFDAFRASRERRQQMPPAPIAGQTHTPPTSAR